MLEACLDSRTPALAFVLSEQHCTMLEERLTRYVLEKFKENGHTLYRADAAQQQIGKDNEKGDGKPKPRPRPKKRPKESEEDDEEEGEDEEEDNDAW